MTYYYSKVFLRLHWGYAIRKPSTKARPALLLPPPTTLVGALSYSKYRGIENIVINKKDVGSPAYEIYNDVKATAKIESPITYIEDIINGVTSAYVKRPLKNKHNIIPLGKVYSPNGRLVAVFITSALPREKLEKMSWEITRIGCKECLVNVEDVEIGEAQKVSNKVVETSYYFPATVKVVEGEEFISDLSFWNEKGYIIKFGKMISEPIKYAIPFSSLLLRSVRVIVEAKEAYKVGDEYTVFA